MYFAFGPEIGYQRLAASGVVNDSGKPQALYGVAINASGTSAVPAFFDGTSSLGTWVFDQSSRAAGTTLVGLPMAMVFPKGLYVSFDAATTRVTTWARQIIT